MNGSLKHVFEQSELDKVRSIMIGNQWHVIKPGSLRLSAGGPHENLQQKGAPRYDYCHDHPWYVFTAEVVKQNPTPDGSVLNLTYAGSMIIGRLDELQAVAVGS